MLSVRSLPQLTTPNLDELLAWQNARRKRIMNVRFRGRGRG